jgi:hypothetical protein
VLDVASEVLRAVRREKTAHKRSMRARVTTLTVTAPRRVLLDVEAARGDLVDACCVDDLVTQEAEDEEAALTVEVELAED